MGFGEVNQLHTGSRGGDNYEKVNEETPSHKDFNVSLVPESSRRCHQRNVF